MSKYSVIGQRLTRVDALDKVTGKARYADDYTLPDMLYGKVLWSTCAHARVRRLDISRAQALEGVMAVVTGADAPHQEGDPEYPNPMTCCIVKDRVIFAGQPVAAVAATSPHIAEEAVKLIEFDYEELPPVMDILEAMKPGSPLAHPDAHTENLPAGEQKPSNVFWYMQNDWGDAAAGFREAAVVLENTFRTSTVHQGYIEPRAALASVDAGGKVTVWSDNQGTFEARELIAEFLHLPLNRVNVIPVEVGGAFGGKSNQVLPILGAMLSQKTGRPVRIAMTREECFKATRPAPASAITVRMGATRDGRLTAAAVNFVYDYGALHGMGGMAEVPFGSFTSLGAYRIPNGHIECHSVYTNKIPSGPYRAPTATQAAFAVESQMDLMARELGIDPLEFRLRNIAATGDPSPDGTSLPTVGFRETIQRMQKHLAQIAGPEGPNTGRGIACGLWSPGAGSAGAQVNVHSDGTAALIVGSVDVSGTRTTLSQMAAEELGIPFEDISVVTGDTDTAPFSVLSAGSMITRSLATPIIRACRAVKDQLCQRAAPQLEAAIEDVEYVSGRVQVKGNPKKFIPFADLARFSWGESQIIGNGTSEGSPSSPVLAVAAADVAVDKETGKVKVLAYAVAQDAGLAVNPMLVEGQMQGAAAQGIGWALMEGSIYDKGVMQNATLLDYRLPTAADLVFIEPLLVEVGMEGSPYGTRGAGEPPLVPVPAAVANAVHRAAGVRLKELPMTPEAVFRALQAKAR